VKGAVDLVWGVHAGSLDTAGDAFTAGDYVTVLPAKDYAALAAENAALRARVAELEETLSHVEVQTCLVKSPTALLKRIQELARAALTPKGGET
jgi:hypothetical protein